jgi:hypothetical protein
MTTPQQPSETASLSRERRDLLEQFKKQRGFLRRTVEGLTDEQAASRSTVSELCLGGLVKHVTGVEARWARFAVGGAEAMYAVPIDWEAQFRMAEGETVAGLLAEYDKVAAHTDELVATLDLDADHALPDQPWFEKGARWSFRQVMLHMIAELAQHSGHADILREAIDGQKTMG